MAKKIRTASAKEGLAQIIDKATELDVQIKALTTESKTAKSIINESIIDDVLESDETSVKVSGSNSIVTLSLAEKLTYNNKSESAEVVEEAIEEGLLEGVISKETTISIPRNKAKEVMDILEAQGLSKFLKIEEKYSVDATGYREFVENASSEIEEGLKEMLSDTVVVQKTPRLKFVKTA